MENGIEVSIVMMEYESNDAQCAIRNAFYDMFKLKLHTTISAGYVINIFVCVKLCGQVENTAFRAKCQLERISR